MSEQGREEVEAAVVAAEQGDAQAAGLWLTIAAQRRRLGLAARKVLGAPNTMQMLALRGLPDISIELLARLAHGAIVAQGAESWTGILAGRRAHRYAFTGKGQGPAVLLLHGLGGSASSMAPLAPALVEWSRRVVLLELPSHGRSPSPDSGPLGAREYGAVVVAALEELSKEQGGKVGLVGNSLGGALSLYAAHERPDLVTGVVGLNPAGAELSEEAMNKLPRSFPDANAGAMRMAEMLFHRTPWPFWLVARDFARNWGTPAVQRILDDARSGSDRSLGFDFLGEIAVPSLILWGDKDRLLPNTSVEDFRRSIPGVRVELIRGCGHVPQLERPALTRRLVTEFLRPLR